MNAYTDYTEPKRWMLVDDNDDVLVMLSSMAMNLTSATVECHDSPESALAAFTADPDAYEVVITDYDMPRMTGIELCRLIQSAAPEQRVILATGSGYFTPEAARVAGFSALLHKPFAFSALVNALLEAGFGVENPVAA
jgi:CheY-like chemotaxis protein